MRLTEQGLKEGGLGVGLVQGYALGSGYKEMLAIRDMTLAVPMIHRAIEQRLNVTVEAYPYGAASTGIGAAFLAPENLSRTA